jgi:hypothetical protein
VSDAYSTPEDSVLSVPAPGVLANDIGADGSSLQAIFGTNPSHGAVVLSRDGTFRYTPKGDYNGADSFLYYVWDGTLESHAVLVNLTVTPVNDAPSFTKGADQTVLENCGLQTVARWATAISVGPVNESPQVLTFTITNNTNTTLFSVQPAVAANGTLTFTPGVAANGTATLTLTLTDDATRGGAARTTVPQTFTITVTAINDAPSFTKGADQTVLEDCGVQTVGGWATNVSAGPSNESGQTLNFIVTNDNCALFAVQPAVSPTGTLVYTPSLNMNGSAIVTVQIHDDGGTANGGVDTSVSQTFFLTVSEVNDAPTAVDDAYPMLEDGILTLTPEQLLSNDVRGPANESAQNLALVDVGAAHVNCIVSLDAGIITVRPTPDFNGTASFSYTIQDNGTTAGTSDPKTASGIVTIMVTAVNDVPSFTKGADQTVLENCGPQTVPSWATSISAGPADESGQALDFIVTNDNTTLFSTQPAVAANGTLTYTLALNTNGSATVTICIHDDGGTANAGVDTSIPQTFTITVNPHNDPPVDTYTVTYTADANGTISGTSPQTVNQGASSTAVTATPDAGYHFVSWSDGIFTAARTDTNVMANINATASFAVDTFAITVISGSHGTATPGTGLLPCHAVQAYVVKPDAGYMVDTLAVDGVVVNEATNRLGYTVTLISIEAPHTIVATFASIPDLTVPVNDNFEDTNRHVSAFTPPSHGAGVINAGSTIDNTPVAPFPVSPRHTMVLTIDIKTMTVDSARVVLDAPAAIVEDRTLVPLRAVVEHLGGSIDWDAKTRQVTLKARDTTISLTIGKSTTLVNGKSLAIDPKNSKVVPVLSSSRTMLPLRFVSENLGLQVDWNAETRTITVNWED